MIDKINKIDIDSADLGVEVINDSKMVSNIKNPATDIVKHKFCQTPVIVREKYDSPSTEELRKEPTFSRMKWKDALEASGPITYKLLKRIGKHVHFDRQYALVDVQVQFLKRGQYTTNHEGTAWHLDGATAVHPILSKFIGFNILENRGALDIDDTLTRDRKMRFFSVFFNDISCTEYVEGPFGFDAPRCISSWSTVSKLVDDYHPKTFKQRPGHLMEFDDTVLHRATAAICDGWRYWIRVGEIDFLPRPRDRHIDTVYEQ